MSPTFLHACLSALGWSRDDLADHIECRPELVQAWLHGTSGQGVPPPIAEWVEGLAGMVAGSRPIEEWVAWRDAMPATYPPPTDWRWSSAVPDHSVGQARDGMRMTTAD